jgi:hypothetical protein
MSIIRKILSGFIVGLSAFMVYCTYSTPEANAWAVAMTGWVVIFLDEF